jgi:hypothetical protein
MTEGEESLRNEIYKEKCIVRKEQRNNKKTGTERNNAKRRNEGKDWKKKVQKQQDKERRRELNMWIRKNKKRKEKKRKKWKEINRITTNVRTFNEMNGKPEK